MFNITFGYVSCYNIVMFLFLLCNKILLDFCFVSVKFLFLFLFVLFHDLDLKLGPPYSRWVRINFSLDCFHACVKFHQKIKLNFHDHFLEYNG